MYGLLVEYAPEPGRPPLPVRWHYRELLARQPGCGRRIELQADGYRRLIDLFLFASSEAVEAALKSAERRAFVAAQGGCADTAPALLVREGDALGGTTILLRRTPSTSPPGGQRCWRDSLASAAPRAELW